MQAVITNYERDLSINEACSILNVTNPTVYKLIAQGQLDSYKVGRSRRITRESLQRLRQGHTSHTN